MHLNYNCVVLNILILTFCQCLYLQAHNNQPKPRLIVVVSYDQFRGDYPSNFSRFEAEGGFARCKTQGTWFSHCYYQHANLITGPGHATLLTGCYPALSGIPGNDFCDSEKGGCTYCVLDNGTVSPVHLAVPTLGDRMRDTWKNSKVIGIALKDRAAVLMAGKKASSVVWLDVAQQKWVSSNYYPQPHWLATLNTRYPLSVYSEAVWNTVIPEHKLPAEDDVDVEGSFTNKRYTFPHILPPITDTVNFGKDFSRAPQSVEHLFNAATRILHEEQLGTDTVPDLLCIGVSTTDVLGHTFGPDSREVQELYVTCDKTLATFLQNLDSSVGKANYVLVVTSDHGVAPIPEYYKKKAAEKGLLVDAGRLREKQILQAINTKINSTVNTLKPLTNWIYEIYEPSIYFNKELAKAKNVSLPLLCSLAIDTLRKIPGIGFAATPAMIQQQDCAGVASEQLCILIRNSLFPQRSGDVLMYPKEHWIIGGAVASHGTPNEYDRYVPLMILGGGFCTQKNEKEVAPVDIAPTLAKMLGLEMVGVHGKVIQP